MKRLALCVPLVLAALTGAGCAVRQWPAEQSLTRQTTLVGCLGTGAAPGEYLLRERKSSGTALRVAGHPDLPQHAANHAVRIIGFLDSGDRPGLQAIRIEHLAASCAVPF